jgi:antitoxin component YwqK of YwqJK toxin-antitoxin module
MKGTIYTLLCAGLLLFSCTEDQEETAFAFQVTQLEDEDLIERMPNYYREYFPGKKQMKLGGPTDNEGRRHGAWESYYEHGQMNSMTYFVHGVKDGHSIVYHPNGAIHYVGEYKNDQKIGLWKSYDDKGELISEDEF